MTTLNRQTAPPLQGIDQLHFIEPELKQLHNGIPLHIIDGSVQEVIELELIFPAGRWFETKFDVAGTVSKLLQEGTQQRSAAEIAGIIDYYGASIKCKAGYDTGSLVLYCLIKNLSDLLPLILELLTEASFPQHEIDLFLKNQKQKLLVNEQKTDYLAQKAFFEQLFGHDHPYGYPPDKERLDSITRDDLAQFYHEQYGFEDSIVIAAGYITKEVVQLLDEHIGALPVREKQVRVNTPKPVMDIAPLKKKVVKEGSLQSSIIIGKRLFTKGHDDYQALQVLNTVLGGYFGSRLMSNIREDKGFTYGIYSGVYSLVEEGYLSISTDVGKDVTQAALYEIYLEIRRLREEIVPKAELELVQNYLTGHLLTQVDGPFNMAKTLRSLILYDLNTGYLHELFNTIQNMTADRLMALAGQYLDEDSLIEVVAG